MVLLQKILRNSLRAAYHSPAGQEWLYPLSLRMLKGNLRCEGVKWDTALRSAVGRGVPPPPPPNRACLTDLCTALSARGLSQVRPTTWVQIKREAGSEEEVLGDRGHPKLLRDSASRRRALLLEWYSPRPHSPPLGLEKLWWGIAGWSWTPLPSSDSTRRHTVQYSQIPHDKLPGPPTEYSQLPHGDAFSNKGKCLLAVC